jgi:hypothetical protein
MLILYEHSPQQKLEKENFTLAVKIASKLSTPPMITMFSPIQMLTNQ